MAKGFRADMTWLHTWSGLIVGWLLFVIFVTGTSSYYRGEITLWMQPEVHKSISSQDTFDIAIQKALEANKKSDNVRVTFPYSRSNLISVRAEAKKEIRQNNNQNRMDKRSNQNGAKSTNAEQKKDKAQKNNNKRKRTPTIYYDATTGELITPRATAGGNFLYRFHFELYNMPRNIARWIVGIATMSMLVAIITGIIIHKRIFKDIFTFRSKDNTRGWMDAHILPAVATLPFLIMITYSGLLLLTNTIMPWGMKVYYGDDYRAYRQEMFTLTRSSDEELNKSMMVNKSQENKKMTKENMMSGEGKESRMKRGEKEFNMNRGEKNKKINQREKSSQRDRSNRKGKNSRDNFQNVLTQQQLLKVLEIANTYWPDNVGRFIITTEKGMTKIEVLPKSPTNIFNLKFGQESIIFNAKTAEILKKTVPPISSSSVMNTNTAFMSLHMAHFADWSMRFLFFVAGIFGIIISGTGLVLWIQKRKKKNIEKKSIGFWLVDKLNLGTMAGVFIAIAAYFIANRFIPAEEMIRKEYEINTFFIVWLLSYLHAFFRDTLKAWREQLLFGAFLFLSLPFINAIVVFDSLSEFFTRDAIFINFDIFFIFMAAVLGLIAFIVTKKIKAKELKC